MAAGQENRGTQMRRRKRRDGAGGREKVLMRDERRAGMRMGYRRLDVVE